MNEMPIMEEIINFKGRYHEILAIMCALRRPKLSVLWLGAVISGLTPRILDFVKRGAPPLDPNAFAWTGCPQLWTLQVQARTSRPKLPVRK